MMHHSGLQPARSKLMLGVDQAVELNQRQVHLRSLEYAGPATSTKGFDTKLARDLAGSNLQCMPASTNCSASHLGSVSMQQ